MQKTHQQNRATGSTSDANVPQFFKIVHDVTIEKQMLRIPPKFIRKYGNSLPKKNIVLKVPSGKKWRMELKKCGNEVWLDRGWKEFADYYSMGFGHFLVFAYNGNSCFDVLIFDKSGSEIKYPIKNNHGNELQIEESDDDISVEILGDFTSLRNKKPLSSSVKVERKQFDGAEVLKKKKVSALATSKIRAIERANAYKTENPHFVVTMRPSYVSNSFTLNIPLVFARKYFNEKHQNVCLRAAEKTWSTMYYNKHGNSRLNCGWSDFVRDNDLEVGDVCVFELIENVKNSLEVVIFRDNEGTASKKKMQ